MESFKIMQLKTHENFWFAEFWSIYAESFPLNERRDYEQQIEVLNNPAYQLDIYFSEDKLSGFISFWNSKEFIFIEHLAITPAFQNKGLGSSLLKLFIESHLIPVILEIEPPIDNITNRRLRFYDSLGFVMNSHFHFQPPYHPDDKPLQLNILSYPDQITKENYNRFSSFQRQWMDNLETV